MNRVVRKALYLSIITLSIFYAQAKKVLSRSTCCVAVSECFQDKDAGKCGIRCSSGCYNCGTSIFIPRSQGANTARELVGWQRQLFQPYLVENYVTVAITSEYTRSFRPERIARRLFCTDCLTFAGSSFNKNNGSEVVADNFGLSRLFRGTLAIKPRIENYLVDINLFFGLNEWWPGLYWRLHAPLVHTRWSLGLDECKPCADRTRGDTKFPFCYMSSDPNPNNTVTTARNLREALSGKFLFGDMQTRWCFGRFSFCPLDKMGVADLDLITGYNIIQSDFAHFGLYAQLVVPTGNRPKAKYIFEPIRGNGHHWEFGIGLSAHKLLFDDGYLDGHSFGVYFEGNITNVFKNEQLRSFDFTKNGLLSRYLLLKEFDVVTNIYKNNLINAINFATRTAVVRVGYKLDFSLKLAYQFGNFMGDLGYNLYARSAETVCIKTDCPCDIDQRRFGFKGTEPVCMGASATTVPVNTVDPNATLFTTSCPPKTKQLSTDDMQSCKSTKETDTETQTEYESTPVYISCRDLDPNSAAQCSMLTNKFFAHVGYIWRDYCYQPHVGIGGEVEVDSRHTRSSLNQWGIWIKGGVTF